MQNNVTELTQRLLRALDSNYNVIDMPAVIEIVSLLEKVTITKELLETTRLGKHVNELRRKTDNDSLSKRAKELVKKWRNMVLPVPDSNGQLKQTQEHNKRPASKSPPDSGVKRQKLNGQTAELELSDNSNSSFKDVISSKLKRDVILINSDSNSSFPDTIKQEPLLEQQQPKKRGRKKGSKNHKNLLDEAETSFSNKLAVSRANSKVKTTQELIAGLQNKNNTNLAASPLKPKEDLNVRAAKLTERVSIIDQKLNTNANRYKNSQKKLQKITIGEKSDKVIESGSVINDKSLLSVVDEDVIVVDDVESVSDIKPESPDVVKEEETESLDLAPKILSLSVEEALAQLPPIDESVLQTEPQEPLCTCILKQNKDFSIDDDEADDLKQPFEFIEDSDCHAKSHFEVKRQDSAISVEDLHSKCIENVNGNWGVGESKSGPEMTEDGLYVNVVPNVNTESIPKDVKTDFDCENFKKYSFSECSTSGERTERVFREWHEVLDTPSYNGEIFKILPYVIID